MFWRQSRQEHANALDRRGNWKEEAKEFGFQPVGKGDSLKILK